MKITLPYPDKVLWPNGRAHWAVEARAFKRAKQDAQWAAISERANLTMGDGKLPIHITVHCKARGPAPDEDNIIAAAKAHLDGIAAAIGIDDRHFAAATVEIAASRTGKFVYKVGL